MRKFYITFSNEEEIVFDIPNFVEFGYNKFNERDLLTFRSSEFEQTNTSLNNLNEEIKNKLYQNDDIFITTLKLISDNKSLINLDNLNARSVEYRVVSADRNVDLPAKDYEELTIILT